MQFDPYDFFERPGLDKLKTISFREHLTIVIVGLGFLAGLFAIFSVADAIVAVFGQPRVISGMSGALIAIVFGTLGYLLRRRRPKVFGSLEVFAAVSIAAYVGQSTVQPSETSGAGSVGQVIKMLGMVFLFVNGLARIRGKSKSIESKNEDP